MYKLLLFFVLVLSCEPGFSQRHSDPIDDVVGFRLFEERDTIMYFADSIKVVYTFLDGFQTINKYTRSGELRLSGSFYKGTGVLIHYEDGVQKEFYRRKRLIHSIVDK